MAKKQKEEETEKKGNTEQEITPEEAAGPSREQELEKQLAEKCDQLQRLAAEYDNFRKRSQREKDELYTAARTNVIIELLPVIDNFERAAKNGDANPAEFKKGIEMTYSMFTGVLKKLGIEPFGEPGEAFDPNIHNAVLHLEDEKYGENVIADVLSKGYKVGEKTIRSATVTVAN